MKKANDEFSPKRLFELKKTLVKFYKENFHDKTMDFPTGAFLYAKISDMISKSGETVNERAISEFWNGVNEANDDESKPYSFNKRKNISINHIRTIANFLEVDFSSLLFNEQENTTETQDIQIVVQTHFKGILINFHQSQELELQAEEAYCLTSNLIWATREIDKILDDLKNNPTKKYKYILTEPTPEGKSNKSEILEKLSQTDLKNQVEIRILAKAERFKNIHNSVVLPITNDHTVYRNTLYEGNKQNILVSSTITIKQGQAYDKDLSFDIVVSDKQLVTNFVEWFKAMWNEIGTSE